MHILNITTASLDDLIEPVDLGQAPAPVVVLSFSDSDLAGLASALGAGGLGFEPPEVRLASLRDLRHPMSVDLWVDRLATHARVVLVRLLGGYDWWAYGCDRLAALARERGIALALLPGECREADARLAALSTVDAAEQAALLGCFREGGPQNMAVLIGRLAALAVADLVPELARPVPRIGAWQDAQLIALDAVEAGARPLVPILFYRSMLLANDAAPVSALVEALAAEGIDGLPIFVPSLRDAAAVARLEGALGRLRPAAIVTATAFAVGEGLFERLGVPVLQVVPAVTRREAWAGGARGLAPADLAMHVVLPELDGRVLAGAVSFKMEEGTGLLANRAEPGRVAQVARRIAALLRLRATPRAERRLVVLIPDYPAAAGRTGYAVGLDVPASVLALLADLAEAGYRVDGVPATARDLMRLLERESAEFSLDAYRAAGMLEAVTAAWGEAEAEAPGGVFRFRAARFGNVVVALAPDRGRGADRRADYHDPALPPRHALVAFGHWLRKDLACHALVHVGAHGTLEWLPGKTVALSEQCFPELVLGALPVVYPFIVSNPGEAAQAKRRIAAVTVGHLTPPLVGAGLSEAQRSLERLVDEYAQADGLDRRRRERLARLIVETARETGLAGEAGVGAADDAQSALVRIDAWLCDLKDLAVKDGLHVLGRDATGEPGRQACAAAERAAMLAALDGRHVAPGPAGAPVRGRRDVLPTGRNLYAADPRTFPTATAFALGQAAADEVLRRHVQEHGDWPRALVIDLWGSASLRTGGEAIAQGLALMGCRPVWDAATARVTGVEVLPPASVGRPRVDVTWRISGLFRDMFATQIALLDAAVAAVAAREETVAENPLVAAGARPQRIFGAAPGVYGAGPEERLASGDWDERAELGRAYLEGGAFAFGGADGEGVAAGGAFAERVAAAELLVHPEDDAGRDILEGSADVAFVGGFAAAAAALGGRADLVVLDTTDPERPRARSLREAVTRVVRARALNPRFIAGQMRHGPRGAAEFAETVDRLVGFAETTDAVSEALIEAVHRAYVEDDRVRAFLLDQNPAAARAIAERFAAARRRGLWHPRRNAVDEDLEGLIADARLREARHD